MSDLPHGWETATLTELIGQDGVFCDGDWIESKDQDPNGATRLLQLADLGDGKFLDKSARFVNDATFERLRCTEVLKDDILIARMPDPLGRACMAPNLSQRCITVVDVAIVRPGLQSVNPKWLMHSLNAPEIRQGIQLQASGSTRQRIARGKLAEIPLPVPPRAEQTRIADKLDAVMTRVDATRERLDRIPAILKRFRQSVLSAAISGMLINELKGMTGARAWKVVRLPDVAQSRLGKMLDRAKNVGDETPYLRNINVRWFHFDCSDIQVIRVSPEEAVDLSVSKGDILVCEGGEPGRCAVWNGEDGRYVFQKALHRIRVGPKVTSQWISYALKEAADSGRLAELFTGTTIKHLTGAGLAPGLLHSNIIKASGQACSCANHHPRQRLCAAGADWSSSFQAERAG